jgi:two-component system C4-dicarboxylate transport response regulator DctD
MDQHKILIVDDNPDTTTHLKICLESYGFSIDTFNDPKVALSNFKPAYYDSLLIDINMPDLNGVQLYQEIKKIDNNAKIYFTTGYEPYYDALKEVLPTFDLSYFILTPITIERLVKKITDNLEAKKDSH